MVPPGTPEQPYLAEGEPQNSRSDVDFTAWDIPWATFSPARRQRAEDMLQALDDVLRDLSKTALPPFGTPSPTVTVAGGAE